MKSNTLRIFLSFFLYIPANLVFSQGINFVQNAGSSEQRLSNSHFHASAIGELFTDKLSSSKYNHLLGIYQPAISLILSIFPDFQINIWPTLTNSVVNISGIEKILGKNDECELVVFDLSGKEIFTQRLINSLNVIPVHHLPQGSYLFSILNNKTTIISTNKIIIQP